MRALYHLLAIEYIIVYITFAVAIGKIKPAGNESESGN